MAKKPTKKGAGKPPVRKRSKKQDAATNGNGEHTIPDGPSPQEVDQGMADLLAKHLGKLIPLLEAEKNAKARVTKAYELAKNEGVPKKDLKIALTLETDEGEKKLRDDIANTLKIARWMRTALGTQMDLFGPPQADLPKDRHYHAGRRAAMQDLLRKPPEMLAHEDAQDWMRGWDEGRAALNVERAQGFKPLGETVADVVEEAIPPIGTEPPTHQEASH